VSIAFMFWSGTANVHSFVLLFLAVGLFFSVNWCVRARIKTHCTQSIFYTLARVLIFNIRCDTICAMRIQVHV
jgi:hypothetical protein